MVRCHEPSVGWKGDIHDDAHLLYRGQIVGLPVGMRLDLLSIYNEVLQSLGDTLRDLLGNIDHGSGAALGL